MKGEENEIIKDFHTKEAHLLNILYQEIERNEFIINSIKDNKYKLDLDLVLNDYISFHYHKYNELNSINITVYKDLINLLLNLRFHNGIEVIKENINDKVKILLIKIIWIESNSNYISSILKIFLILRNNFKDQNIFINKIKNNINSGEIKYIVNPKKNPEHTREVNECYYKFLALICLSIISEYNNCYNYYQSLKDSLKIFKDLNDDLQIYLNEMYIIDEFLEVRNAFEKNYIKNEENFLKIEIKL